MELLGQYFLIHKKMIMKEWHKEINRIGLNGTGTIQLKHKPVNNAELYGFHTSMIMLDEFHYYGDESYGNQC